MNATRAWLASAPEARRSAREAPDIPWSQRGGCGPRQRHLVHVFPSFNMGGVQVRFVALAQALGDRFRHTVISLNGDYAAAGLVPASAPVSYADPLPRLRSTYLRLRRFRRLLATLQPDLLLTHNWGAMEVVMANAIDRWPHIHLEDGFGPEEAHRQFRRRIWTRRLLLARSEVIVPSRTLQRIATDAWGLDRRRVHYIPNGVAPLAVGPPPPPLGVDLPANVPRIVWAGALRREKNPLRLLRAFASMKHRAVLLVIGDGPERASVLAEADRLGVASRIRLLGNRTDARRIIAQSDVLVLSSDTEQMPLVVLEAMDAGLPIAATDVGDIHDMVAEENRRFVVPPDDAALGRALDALVSDAALRSRIGRANRTRQRALYALPHMVTAYETTFEKAGAWATDRGSG